MLRTLAWIPLTLLIGATAAFASPGGDLWLHVRVEDSRDDGETVRVNVPLDLVEALLPLIETDELAEGKVQVLEWDLDEVDVRKVWNVLAEAKEGELVTVEGTDGNVRVAKKGKYLLVDVKEDGETRVDIKVPLRVVDALLSGDENELDVLAAVRALREHGAGELVSVTDRESSVRVWVDGKNTSR